MYRKGIISGFLITDNPTQTAAYHKSSAQVSGLEV